MVGTRALRGYYKGEEPYVEGIDRVCRGFLGGEQRGALRRGRP
jgi:hypothetical protein